jgi:predicted nucleic acid-binding protein
VQRHLTGTGSGGAGVQASCVAPWSYPPRRVCSPCAIVGTSDGIPLASEAWGRGCSVYRVARFVVDCETLLQIAAGEIEVAPEHKLLAPVLVRSQALSSAYAAARRGDISAAEGIARVRRVNSLNVRFLGDKVLQQQAWEVADELGWDTTYDAEYVALTKLQADALVTSNRNLAREVSGLVEIVTIDALRLP